MRCSTLLCLGLVLGSSHGNAIPNGKHLAIRQDNTASAHGLPTLSSDSAPAQPPSTSASPSGEPSENPSSTAEMSASNSASSSEPRETASSAVSKVPSATVSDGLPISTPTLTPTASGNATTNDTTSEKETAEALPLPPRITPALSVGGVFLILTGIVYALIGVKNKWLHIFLSTAFLTSLAVLVLIVYVLNPPVSNAVQGAYLVGIVMSGVIFGGGALVFKEVTEGLGCLLGGFCFSMWFLILKPGGLITNTGGKGIFIGVFCVVCWSLSFSHYTRPYGLIFSTSISGATAFVVGIDCFSKAGLKEFWVYIWALNDDLFPLNTNTYPITRGTRVETVVIVLGTIIGIISQIKLWKVVQDRQKARQAVQAEDGRRRDAVEEALGRHIARQNDRDRSEWEKRYGDRLDPNRNTWVEANSENKGLSSISTTEVGSTPNSDSNESLEMTAMPDNISRAPMYSSKSNRQSNVPVQPIQEVEEEDYSASERKADQDRSLAEAKLNGISPQLPSERFSIDLPQKSPRIEERELSKTSSTESIRQTDVTQSLKPSNSKPSSRRTADRLHLTENDARATKRSSLQSLKDLKRKSMQSMKSGKDSEKSPQSRTFGESQEALIKPAASIGGHSRASSVAATLDDENERLEMPTLDIYDLRRDSTPPQILISPVHGMSFEDSLKAGTQGPPSPSGLSDQFEADPEEMRRPTASKTHGLSGFDFGLDKRQSADGHPDAQQQKGPMSSGDASQGPNGEVLTKGALEKVPSQMSNVVLSYRTNEWAKHIATAEAPVYEEPDSITVQDEEPSTHLAPPSPKPEETGKPEVSQSPPLPSPVASVAPSDVGIKVNPELQPEPAKPRPTSDLVEPLAAPPASKSAEVSPTPSRAPSTVSTTNRRSFTDPIQSQVQPSIVPKANRRTSHPVQRHPSTLQSTPIHEDVATDFTGRPNAPKRASSNSQYYYTPASSQVDLRRSSSQQYPSAFKRTDSFNGSNVDLSNRPPTVVSTSPYHQHSTQSTRPETRLNDIGVRKSHQPLQRNNPNESNRADKMANWRMQLAQQHNTNVVPMTTADNRYAQQMHDYGTEKLRKEHDKQNRARKEAMVDQSMRTQGMIDAHREVLKRMQSQANEKMKDNQKQPGTGR